MMSDRRRSCSLRILLIGSIDVEAIKPCHLHRQGLGRRSGRCYRIRTQYRKQRRNHNLTLRKLQRGLKEVT